MKRIKCDLLIFLVLGFLLFNRGCTCNSNNKEINIENNKDINIEASLILQANNYLQNKLYGKPSVNKQYSHTIGLNLNRIRYPNQTRQEVIDMIEDEFYTEGIDKFVERYNLKFNYHETLDSIHFNNDIIYLFTYLMSGKNNLDTIHDLKPQIAITNNNGINWYFIGVDDEYKEETKEIIREYYSVEISDRISDYIFIDYNVPHAPNVFVPRNSVERDLKNQFLNYQRKFLEGNIKEVMNYISPLIFQHLKSVYPEEWDASLFEEMMTEQVQSFQEWVKDSDVTFNINKILNVVTLKDDIIYIIRYTVDTKNGSMNGVMCAIKNKVDVWKFFEINEEEKEIARQILSIEYSESEIDRILNF